MVKGQGENEDNTVKNHYALSYAWSDYTIGRLKKRDENGNIINPDIVFIYRGTNDMTHSPVGQIADVQFERIPDTDLYEKEGTEYRSFVIAYCKTIQKIRESYPQADIYACTLNYFNRSTDLGWTRKNSYYTLSEINNCIRSIANKMSVGLIEFDKDGITAQTDGPKYYADTNTTGGTHPNTAGHYLMAKRCVADLVYIK